ncbi:unnamed protein product [Linum trigynum]|uniref:Uncharacterized protein n=1 Tax=Linum trigynum TaxID=586398 RepID=A0AAV2GG76_9ROSI
MSKWAANDVVAATKRCGEAAKTVPPMEDELRKKLQQSIDYWSPEAMRRRREGKDAKNEGLIKKQPPTMDKDATDETTGEAEVTDVDELKKKEIM